MPLGTLRTLRYGWICALILQFAGCTLFGPEVAFTTRLAYNDVVHASEQSELLLNLVRLRYLEAPEFLAMSAIASQMTFEAGASVSGDFGRVESANSAFIAPGGLFQVLGDADDYVYSAA